MMREEILKELELWPLWTLKQPLLKPAHEKLPEISALSEASTLLEISQLKEAYLPDTQFQAAQTQPLPESASPAVQQMQQAATFVAYQNAAANFLALHPTNFSADEALLWKNITKAMQMDFILLEHCPSVQSLMQTQTAKVVMIFGETLAQQLLQRTESIEFLCENPHTLEKIPCVITFDLAHLLHKNGDKAHAWKAICQAMLYVK